MDEGLGGYVRRIRTERGLTPRQVYEAAGLTKGYLSTLEGNKIALPASDIRRRLAKALGFSHLDLLIAAGEINTDNYASVGIAHFPDKGAQKEIRSKLYATIKGQMR